MFKFIYLVGCEYSVGWGNNGDILVCIISRLLWW